MHYAIPSPWSWLSQKPFVSVAYDACSGAWAIALCCYQKDSSGTHSRIEWYLKPYNRMVALISVIGVTLHTWTMESQMSAALGLFHFMSFSHIFKGGKWNHWRKMCKQATSGKYTITKDLSFFLTSSHAWIHQASLHLDRPTVWLLLLVARCSAWSGFKDLSLFTVTYTEMLDVDMWWH